MNRHIIALAAAFLILPLGLKAQLFYNNGAQVTVNQGAVMIVKTNSLEVNTGIIDNAGHIIVEDDLINNDSITGLGAATGIFEVQGDWINNAIFNEDQSLVDLSGADQLISGTVVTNFYNLTTSGTGIKRHDNINAFVSNTLDLTSVELATDLDTMFVTNTNVGAIRRTTGFVSSFADGRLVRYTNAVDRYLFPTGSSIGTTPRYRPIELVPNSSALHHFGVRFANFAPTSEGFDRDERQEVLCNINPEFYHLIDRILGNDPVDITMFYRYVEDGEWPRMAHWQNAPQWEEIQGTTLGAANGFETIASAGWNDFSEPAFALATIKPLLEAGNDEEILLGQSVQLDPTYFGAIVDTFEWSPPDGLDCDNCEEPVAAPSATTLYNIRIVNSLGCEVEDSLTVIVLGNTILLPTAFTPNNDGNNDFFRVLNQNVASMTLQIFNRWGDLVFETDDPTIGWDGTVNNIKQPMDNYVYLVEYRLEGETGRMTTESGNLTLLR